MFPFIAGFGAAGSEELLVAFFAEFPWTNTLLLRLCPLRGKAGSRDFAAVLTGFGGLVFLFVGHGWSGGADK